MKLLFGLLSFALAGCGSDPPVITSLTLDPVMVARGADVNVSIAVSNFELRAPQEESHALRAADTGGHEEDGDYPDGGHFHVYLDDTETNPMLIDCPDYCEHGASTSPARARIPDDAAVGAHKVIVRLNDDHHEFLKPEITAEATLTVLMEN
jgi:hypothetical protein